jgi:chloride channel 7
VQRAHLTALTLILQVPAGLFIPSMMSGAAMGRLTGELLSNIVGEAHTDPGLFSLCGAAAMLGALLGLAHDTRTICP